MSTTDITTQIPKGTLVFPVTHNMHSNESVYPSHDTFDPSRFSADKSTMTEGHYTFGFGRRDCPGMHLAAQLLYAVVAHLLAHYSFGRAVDPSTGEEVPVHFRDYTGNAIGRCVSCFFSCVVVFWCTDVVM